jgi:tetratricopeptide (TPR) repeat protein
MQAATTNTRRGGMVDCRYVSNEELAERYLNGQLAGAEQDEFEVHLLECPACLESVESLRELRTAVASEAPRIRLAPERRKSPFWLWSLGTASLLILITFALFQWRRPGNPVAKNQAPSPQQAVAPQAKEQPVPAVPTTSAQKEALGAERRTSLAAKGGQPRNVQNNAPTLPSQAPETEIQIERPSATVAETKPADIQPHARNKPRELTPAEAIELYKLAEVHPAQYSFPGPGPSRRPSKRTSAVENTGPYDAASTAFQHAMVAYLERRYRDASEMLENAEQVEPNAPNINFYLGVSRLLLGRPDDAILALNKVTDEGKSRYVQSAHVYLAKAFLQKTDLKHAEAELLIASNMAGQLKTDATSLLDRVRALRTALEVTAAPPQ